jgi:hypothetical protein
LVTHSFPSVPSQIVAQGSLCILFHSSFGHSLYSALLLTLPNLIAAS